MNTMESAHADIATLGGGVPRHLKFLAALAALTIAACLDAGVFAGSDTDDDTVVKVGREAQAHEQVTAPEMAHRNSNAGRQVVGVPVGVPDAGRSESRRREDNGIQHDANRQPGQANLAALFAAIKTVETGGDASKIGDNGRSRGAFQISREYWIDGGGDAAAYRRGVLDDHQCRAVMLRYWKRYCPQALNSGDWQTLSRIHNGGNRGATKISTLSYWRKVERELAK